MRKPLILVGGGGHCRSCIDVIDSTGIFDIKGILDAPHKIGTEIDGYAVVGSDHDAQQYIDQGYGFLVTVGNAGSADKRRDLWGHLQAQQAQFVTVVSPRAYVSKHASVGLGTIVMHDALINAGAKVGHNCIVNSKALIEHDAEIGDHVHVATAAVLNGGVSVADGAFIGSHAVTKQGISLPRDVFVKAGSIYKGEC